MGWNVMDIRNSLHLSFSGEMARSQPSFRATALDALCNHQVGLRFQRSHWNPIRLSVLYTMRRIVSFPIPGIPCMQVLCVDPDVPSSYTHASHAILEAMDGTTSLAIPSRSDGIERNRSLSKRKV
mmetsp:Transcript_8320/g.51857  ORF Transcript_8320/g.51857 Transcript_8320/m.51857 type:complete len:125 (-) Transcript_8320:2016-2390(-)